MCSKQNRRFKSKRFQHDYRINDSKTSTKYIYHVSVNVNLMVKKCNWNQKWKSDKCRCEC